MSLGTVLVMGWRGLLGRVGCCFGFGSCRVEVDDKACGFDVGGRVCRMRGRDGANYVKVGTYARLAFGS